MSRWDDRYDLEAARFEQRPVRTAGKWYLWVLAVVIAVAIIGGVVSWAGSWAGEAKRITSPDNVRDQNTQIIQAWEDMEAAAQNYCAAKSTKKGEGDPALIESPELAYAGVYRRNRVEYNRRMANLYEAQAVRNLPLPSNLRSYPERAPTLEEKAAEVC